VADLERCRCIVGALAIAADGALLGECVVLAADLDRSGRIAVAIFELLGVAEATAVFLLPNWPVNAVFAPLTTGPAAGETLLFVWATSESFFSPACTVA
jgi:hypothetical protein